MAPVFDQALMGVNRLLSPSAVILNKVKDLKYPKKQDSSLCSE
jgi:hypothetical protein